MGTSNILKDSRGTPIVPGVEVCYPSRKGSWLDMNVETVKCLEEGNKVWATKPRLRFESGRFTDCLERVLVLGDISVTVGEKVVYVGDVVQGAYTVEEDVELPDGNGVLCKRTEGHYWEI